MYTLQAAIPFSHFQSGLWSPSNTTKMAFDPTSLVLAIGGGKTSIASDLQIHVMYSSVHTDEYTNTELNLKLNSILRSVSAIETK